MSTSTTDPGLRAGGQEADLDLEAASERRRMLIIVNPYATTVSDRLRKLVVYALQGRFEVDAVDTQAPGHATELCREAAHEGYDVVVAFGGDGTVNEAANGLYGSSTPLCCLPGGSANVFGKLLGIPGDVVDATEHLLAMADRFRPRRVDLATVDGRRFTFTAGVGIDASVVQRVDANPGRKARFGPYYFAGVAVGTVARRYLLNPPRLVAEVGEREITGVTAVVQNGPHFTYFHDRPVDVIEGAQLDSGTLAAGVLTRSGPVAMSSIGLRALHPSARVSEHRRVQALPALTEMTVRSADGRPLPLQVDGDFVGEVQEARFGVDPAALAVVS